MKNKTLNAALAAIALAAAQSSAYALDTGIEWLKFSGFGTLAIDHANVNQSSQTYFNPWLTAAGGTQDSWYAGTDSKLGAQATAVINPALSVTIQGISHKNEKGNFIPTVEWANLKYEFTPDIAVRVGRVGVPAFLISDSLNVGYSQPWIRPPVEAYKFGPIETHIDGVDAIFRFHVGDTTITAQPAFGSSTWKSDYGGSVTKAKLTDIVAANVVVEKGPWLVRYANVRGYTDTPLLPAPVKDNFSSLGLVYDKDAWLVQGEYNWRSTSQEPLYGQFAMKMGYATVGYRIGTVMPNFTFSRFVDETDTGGFGTTENTLMPGVRWDFYKNMDLKVQLDHITRKNARSGLGPKGGPGYTGMFSTNFGSPFTGNGNAVNVLAVGIDFVF